LFDGCIAVFLFGVQAGFALVFPLGSVVHTYLLFSADYADTIEVITGARDVLDRHSRAAGERGA
jgi:hypothetical protein